MSVLILAEAMDPCADRMVRAIAERGRGVHRVDTAWFPGCVGLEAEFRAGRWIGSLSTPGHTSRLEDVRAVWYRSPAAFVLPGGLSRSEEQHIRVEGKFGLGGVLLSLPVRWVNRPDLSATACYKPLQMAAAARAGMTVPRTLVTNSAGAVWRFAADHRNGAGMVTKMFASNSVTEGSGRSVAFTRAVGATELADLAGIESTAHLFQQRVPKAYDARVIVIGTRLFGFAIHAHSEASRLDFRRDYRALSYERIEVPGVVASGVGSMMADLGLLYAAIDFVVDRDGGWVFLGDVNPGGQYGWLEAATGAPLTAGVADLLTHQEKDAP